MKASNAGSAASAIALFYPDQALTDWLAPVSSAVDDMLWLSTPTLSSPGAADTAPAPLQEQIAIGNALAASLQHNHMLYVQVISQLEASPMVRACTALLPYHSWHTAAALHNPIINVTPADDLHRHHPTAAHLVKQQCSVPSLMSIATGEPSMLLHSASHQQHYHKPAEASLFLAASVHSLSQSPSQTPLQTYMQYAEVQLDSSSSLGNNTSAQTVSQCPLPLESPAAAKLTGTGHRHFAPFSL